MKQKENKPLEIIYRRLADLKPDPMNVREHPPEQIAALRASIREYGPTKPIALKPDLTIGAGNGTHQAALLEGFIEWPTVMPDLTPEQWVAYAIADNKIALDSKWNHERLVATLSVIAQGGDVPALTGFKAAELGRLKVSGFPDPRKQVQMGADQFGIIITCESETKQTELLERFIEEGLKVKAL